MDIASSGLELLLDLHECQANVLDDPTTLEKILADAASAAGFEVVSQITHQFNHQGVTLVLILSQSHMALHTWPEERFAAVDVYACGEEGIIQRGLGILRKDLVAHFGARTFKQRVIQRRRKESAPISYSHNMHEKQD